jgi:hypothetical protein
MMNLRNIITESVTIQGHQVSASNDRIEIQTPAGQRYTYGMEVRGFSIPIYSIAAAQGQYVMRYGKPSIGLTGLSYEPQQARLNTQRIASLFPNLGQPELPLTVQTPKGEKSVTFRRV